MQKKTKSNFPVSYCGNMKMGNAIDIGVHNKLFENNSFQQAKTMSNTDTAHRRKSIYVCIWQYTCHLLYYSRVYEKTVALLAPAQLENRITR